MAIGYDRANSEYGVSYLIKGCYAYVTDGIQNPSTSNFQVYMILKPLDGGDGYKIAKCEYAMDYTGAWNLYVSREVFNAMNLTVAKSFYVYLCARYGHSGTGLYGCGSFFYRPVTNTINYYQGNGVWIKCGIFYYAKYYGFIPCIPYYYGEDEQWHEINAGMS